MFSAASLDGPNIALVPPPLPDKPAPSAQSTPDQLRQELEQEQTQNQSLERKLRESRKRLNSALEVQSQLEMDVVDLAKQVSVLQDQAKDLRRNKHQLESDLSQEQMTYMNEKQQWLDKEHANENQIAHLKSENARLRAQLDELQPEEEQQQESTGLAGALSGFSFPKFGRADPETASTAASGTTLTRGHSRLRSIGGGNNNSSSDTAKDKTIDRLKNELQQVQQQTEMVSREYSLRHDQIEAELQHNKELVSRLMEENEGFQVLLAEKAILGGFDADAPENGTGSSANSGTCSPIPGSTTGGTGSLADELSRALTQQQNDEAAQAMKKRVYELEFESKSLRNHNKALTLSLERLVQRLLGFKEFERTVETQGMSGNINSKTIGSFQHRVVSNGSKAGAAVPAGGPHQHLVGRAPGDRSSVMSEHHQIQRRRPGHAKHSSVSSIFSMPGSNNMSNLGPRSRPPVKNPNTWTSLILGGSSNTTQQGPGSPQLSGDTESIETSSIASSGGAGSSLGGLDHRRSVSPPVLSSARTSLQFSDPDEYMVLAGATGTPATASHGIDRVIESELARRPSTHGQKKLRPFTMGA